MVMEVHQRRKASALDGCRILGSCIFSIRIFFFKIFFKGNETLGSDATSFGPIIHSAQSLWLLLSSQGYLICLREIHRGD